MTTSTKNWTFSDRREGCCQTNANSYQIPLPRQASGGKESTPLDQSSSTVQLEILSAVEGALLIEVVEN